MARYSQHAPAVPFADRVLLDVPFAEKDLVKQRGGTWDPIIKRWWIARRDISANLDIFPWIADKDLQIAIMGAWDWARDDDDEEEPPPAATPPCKAPGDVQAILAAKSEWADASAAAAASPPPPLASLPPPCGCLTPPWEHCLHTRPALDDADQLSALTLDHDDESLGLSSGRSVKMIEDIARWW